jgi:hypothetical protein
LGARVSAGMDRQQIIALVLVILMLGSSVAYAATLI